MKEAAPRRWIDDEEAQPAEFARAFMAHENWQPDSARRAALWNKLTPQLGASVTDMPNSVSSGTSRAEILAGRRLARWLKAVLAGASVLVGLLASHALLRSALPPPPAAEIATAAVHVARPVESSRPRQNPARGADIEPLVTGEQPAASLATGNELTGASESDGLSRARTLVPRDALARSKAIRSSAQPPRMRSVRDAAASSSATELTPAAADTANEAALLLRARRVLETAPERALALVAEHERSNPRGAFVEEREVIAIDALHRLGRDAEAQSRAADFARDFPESAHRSHVSDSLNAR